MALEKTLPILLIFCISLFLKRWKILRKEDGRMISGLILNVILPTTIINALATTAITPSLLLLPPAGTLVVVTLLALGFVLVPILGLEGRTRAAFFISFPTLEIGSVGYAFMVAIYGVKGLTIIALFDLGNALFFFMVIPLLASLLGHPTERFRLSGAFLQFVKNPVLWAYGIGFVLNIFHVHVALLSNLFSSLSQGLLLFIMLLIAVEFELSFSLASLTKPVLVMYLKLSVGVIVGLLISLLLRFSGVEQIAVVLGSSLPSSLMTVVYARENKLDVQFLASMLSIALPVATGFSSLLISLR